MSTAFIIKRICEANQQVVRSGIMPMKSLQVVSHPCTFCCFALRL